MNQKRQPKGTDTGGQFAPDVHSESTVDLPGVVEPMRHEVEVDTSIADAYEKALRASHYVDAGHPAPSQSIGSRGWLLSAGLSSP